MQDAKNIRFHITSRVISCSFAFTLDSYLAFEVEEAIDDFISSRKKKIQKDNLSIQKVHNVYEINVNAFLAVCQVIFRVLKNNS